jgi:hypothetical protein
MFFFNKINQKINLLPINRQKIYKEYRINTMMWGF